MDVERKQCDECVYWHKGYRIAGSKMPSTCNLPGEFMSMRGDMPACRSFKDKGADDGR